MNDVKKEIINILKKHDEGLTISSISKELNVNRITATKYIYELLGMNKIRIRKIGMAKLVYLGDG